MDQPLAGTSIALIVASGFAEVEMTEPQRALIKAGAKLSIVSPDQGLVNGWHGKAWGHFFPVDRQINSVLGSDFDMLVLPGGERSLTKLMENPHAKRIIGHFLDAQKPLAAVGQGTRLLAIPGKLSGRTVSAPEEAVETLQAAGATLSEEPVTVDQHLVTAKDEESLELFVEKVVKVFTDANEMKKAA